MIRKVVHSKICLLIIAGTLCSFSERLKAQTYHYSFNENNLEFVTTAAVTGGILLYDRLRPPERIDEFEDIAIRGVWEFDRGAIAQNSRSANSISDVLMYGTLLAPLTLGLSKKSRTDNFGNVLLMSTQGLLINTSINRMVKIWAERPRPYVYRIGAPFIDQQQSKNDSKSFYSGHVATTSYLLFFAAQVYDDLHPDSKLKPLVWGVAMTLPALTGYCRYKAGKHFPTDIIAGYAIGASFGILVPTIYKNRNLSIHSSGIGISLQLRM